MIEITKEMLDPALMSEDDVRAFLARYKNDPALFSLEILGIELDDNQRKIVEAIRDGEYVAISSGRGIGKTISISVVSIWCLCVWANAKVLVTSNTDRQSSNTLWKPLIKILRASKVSEWFDNNQSLVWFKGAPEGANIERLVWSEHNVEAVSGYHSPNMIYLCDEASKYPNAVLENLYASCTEENNKMLLTSNPTLNTGYFHDTQDKDNWTFLEIDSRSSKWTDKRKIEELISEFGIDSDVVRVQVLGKFPRHSSMSIVTQDLISRAMGEINTTPSANDVVSIGLDVGGGGDFTCWMVRRGNFLIDKIKLSTPQEDEIIDKSYELVNQYRASYLTFDKTGIGYFLESRLRQKLPNYCKVKGIIFGEGSVEPDCATMRDWIYRRLQDWLKAGGVIGKDEQLKKQLLATLYVNDNKGRMKLIPKKLIKEEIGHSPDEADALALSCGYLGNLNSVPILNTSQSSNLAQMFLKAGQWDG